MCKKRVAAAVDHNHRTGQFRGILCASCNSGIGMFYDDPVLLRAAADYLEIQPDEPHICSVAGCPGRKRLVSLHKTLPIYKMADKLRLSPDVVLGYMEEHQVPRRMKEHICGVTNRCPGKESLVSMYSMKTGAELESELGVSQVMISKWVALHDVPSRPQGRRPGRRLLIP